MAYSVFAARSRTNFDAERLLESFHGAVERQRLLAGAGAGLDFCVLDQVAEPDDEAALLQQLFDQGVSRAQVPAVTVRLARLADGGDLLAVWAPRELVDPLSLCLLMSDVKVLFESGGSISLPPLEMQFDEYVMWKDQTHAASGQRQQQAAFWQQALARPLPTLEMPVDFAGGSQDSAGKTKRVAVCNIPLSSALADRVRRFSQREDMQARTLLLATLYTLLVRYSGKSDILVGCHFSGRSAHVELKNLVGCFENWLPLRVKCADHPSVSVLLDRIATQLSDVNAHPDVPLHELAQSAGAPDQVFQAAFEVYGNTVDEFSFPLISTRLLRLVLGLATTKDTFRAYRGAASYMTFSDKDPAEAAARRRCTAAEALDPPLEPAPSIWNGGEGVGDGDGDGDGDGRQRQGSNASQASLGSRLQDEATSFGDGASHSTANTPHGTPLSKPLSLGGIELEPVQLPESTDPQRHDDLRLVGVTSPLLRIAFQYNVARFKANTIKRMTAHFARLLEAILDVCERPPIASGSSAGPAATRISALEMLPDDEATLVLRGLNATAAPLPPEQANQCVHQLVERQVARTPDALAVSADLGRDTLTYTELNERANKLANFLRLVGVRQGHLVPVLLARSPWLIVAWLAVLKAGATIMPMDPKFPPKRVVDMIEEAGASVVITESGTAPPARDAPGAKPVRCVLLDKDWERAIRLGSTHAPNEATDPRAPAYAIFTSGSTGKPKGVLLEHRSIVNYVQWHLKYYDMTASDRVFACAGLAFDASMADTWPTLAVGACLLPLADPDVTVVPSRMLDWISRERATMGFLTTQICEMVLEEDRAHPRQDLDALRLLYTGGDRLHYGARQDAPYALVNIYGPTENTINSSMTYVPAGLTKPPTIGSPAPNTQCYVLDPDTLLPVPVGVFGELFLGGAQLAQGYFNLPELTAERFIANPLPVEGDRLYRTGDLVRWLDNGQLEFRGRKDTQVKIRGNRVELTAIESTLLEHLAVKDAVVVAREDVPGQKRLVAYCVPSDESPAEDLPGPELRAFVAARLPAFMCPSDFVTLAELPLTANHKVDRKALPAPGLGARRSSKKAPERASFAAAGADSKLPLLSKICQIMAGILGLADGEGLLHDDHGFFEAGGDSLSAGRVTAQVSRLVGVDVPVSLLYKFPTPKRYCEAVIVAQSGAGRAPADAESPNSDTSSESSPSTFSRVCSYNEESLWLVCQREDSFASQAYNVPFSCRFERPEVFLEAPRLRAALQRLVEASEALQVGYREPRADGVVAEMDGELQSIVERVDCCEADVAIDFETCQLEGDPALGSAKAVKDWLERETYKRFDLTRGPLLRARLLEHGGKQYLLLVVHHIVTDLWSMVLLLDRLFGFYFGGEGTPTEPPFAYSAFVRAQRSFCNGARFRTMMSHWSKRLEGLEPTLELPLDHPRPAQKSFKGDALRFRLSTETSKRIAMLAANAGFTLNVVLLAAFKIVLKTYADTNSVHVGVPSAGRTSERLESVLGYLVNPLVLRTDLSGNPTVTQLLHRVSSTVLDGLDNQQVPFPRLHAELAAEQARGNSDNPLFNVAFVFQRAFVSRPGLTECLLGFDDVPLGLHDKLPRDAVTSLTPPHRHAQFDLTLMLVHERDQISGSLHFCTDVFQRETAQRVVGHLQNLLESLSTCSPDKTRVSELALLAPHEAQLVLGEFSTATLALSERAAQACVHHLVQDQAARTPDRVCIELDGVTLTYGQLDQRANRLANFLRFTGVANEALVPVLMHRTIDLVVAWYAVLKAGGAIMPMDPKYPRERVRVMLEDAHAVTVLTQAELAARIPESFEGRTIRVDADWDSAISLASAEAAPASDDRQGPSSLAYVIFTSGSTGRPKGVMLEHRSLVNYIQWHIDFYAMTPEDRVFATAGLAFDASMADTWPTLCIGACLLPVADSDTSVVPHRLIDWIVRNRATMGFLTTQLCEMFLEEDANNPRPELGNSLRLVYTGGDRLHFGARAGAPYELVNIYGPTENTINSSMTYVPAGLKSPPSIGRPAPNTQCFVLDPESLAPKPIGVYGELFLGGAQLARGYFQRDDLTAERFFEHPGLGGQGPIRLYRTGDLVRWTADGQLDFRGRKDSQVKIRGNRIELTAIETTLLNIAAVKDAVVVVREDGEPGDKQLVAYVVPESAAGTLAAPALRKRLVELLPAFMVPSAFVLMRALPLTANHKVDRRALPAPNAGTSSPAAAATADAASPGGPRSPGTAASAVSMSRPAASSVERQVTFLIASALGCQESSVRGEDDFFEAGGHSLLAARLMSKVRQTFAVDMPLSKFLQHPTPRGVAAFVEEALKSKGRRLGQGPSRLGPSAPSGDAPLSAEYGSQTSDGSPSSTMQARSMISSSLHDSALTSWLQDKRTKELKRSGGGGSNRDALSMTASFKSSALRRMREKHSRQSVARDSPLSMAHSPSWLDNDARLQTFLQSKHSQQRRASAASSHMDASDDGTVVAVLSYNQQSLWFLHKVNPQRVDYVVHVCCIVEADSLDPARFERAVQSLVDRHGSLRTLYSEENGVPYQVIYPPAVPPLETGDKAEAGAEAASPSVVQFHFDSSAAYDLEALTATLDEALHRPWVLTKEAPFRAFLFRTDDQRWAFMLTAHHIAMDGWSLDVLLEDLSLAYDSGSTLGTDAMDMATFARLQKEEMSSAAGNRLWEFWQRQLAGHEAALNLPADHVALDPGDEPSENGDWLHFEVPGEDLARLSEVIKLERATLFMALVAFYAAFLHRYTGKEDILIGTPMACRTMPELDRTVGNITNPVVLRMHVGKQDSFRSLLRQARAVVLSAFEHQELPFAILVERMSSYRQSLRSPLFQVLLSLNQVFTQPATSAMTAAQEPPSLAKLEAGETAFLAGGLPIRLFRGHGKARLEQRASPYDLQLIFSKGSGTGTGDGGAAAGATLCASLQYKTTLFSRETVARMADHLLALIRGSGDHDRLFEQMPILTEAEKSLVLKQWNETGADFPQDVCVHQLVEQQAARAPNRSALSFRGRVWTYRELNARANILARYLRVRAHVEPSSMVGILLERSPNMVLAMLAVAKAGGAYVPMDMHWPPQRLAYVCRDSQMTALICDRRSLGALDALDDAEAHVARVIPLDARWERISASVVRAFGPEAASRDLPPPASSSWGRDDQQWHGSRSTAYMVYTSGSTGNPKGVLVEHRSLVNLVVWHQRNYELTPRDRASQLVGSAFDPVGLEVWPFLASGASVHIVEEATRASVSELADWLHANRITVSLLPTPLLEVFLRAQRDNWPRSLRVLYGGGDRLHVSARQLPALPFRLDNHYGPSEGTIMCTCCHVNGADGLALAAQRGENAVLAPTIGRPISNYFCFVLDEYLAPVPILVAGELFVGGAGLATGYLRRPELTEERFLPMPGALAAALKEAGASSELLGTRLYRTGDRVRFLGDGSIEFIGRVDFQIKIRGMRVELGEIESVIKQHELVREACVLAREDKPGQQRLCAYVVIEPESKTSQSQLEQVHALQSLVKDKLPAYMAPSAWVFLEELPLTANGKVDRRALPEPSAAVGEMAGRAARTVVKPRTGEEMLVADLWRETLSLDQISIHDNFFDLGGHSLAATQLLSLLRDTFAVEVPISRFFADPSVAGLAAAVAELKGDEKGADTGGNGAAGPAKAQAKAPPAPTLPERLGFDPVRECQLDGSVQPAGNSKPGAAWDGSKWQSALVTGATGFLGAFLVHQLFSEVAPHRPGLQIFCLVRAGTDEEACSRLAGALDSYGLSAPDPEVMSLESWGGGGGASALPGSRDATASPRLVVVRGDLGQPMLGLEESAFEQLAERVDMIFHCGAYVHSLYPYSRLRAANVQGTQEVIRLAFSRPSAPAMLLHVSTLSVFAMGDGEGSLDFTEEGPIASPNKLHLLEGYAQSKWVAEHLVREAMKRGLQACIFRPGRITGHSETGIANLTDFMCLFLKGCLQLRAAPKLHWVMDMNPVDMTCEAMVALSLSSEEGPGGPSGRAFNMCHPDPMMLPEYFEWAASFGYKCPIVPYSEWRDMLLQAVKADRPGSDCAPHAGSASKKTEAARNGTRREMSRWHSDDGNRDGANHAPSAHSPDGAVAGAPPRRSSGSIPIAASLGTESWLTAGARARRLPGELGLSSPRIRPQHQAQSHLPSQSGDAEGDMWNERNTLYPVLPMFAPDEGAMQPKAQPHFACTRLTSRPHPPCHELNSLYFERMVQQGFLAPPPRGADSVFAFE